MGATEILVLYTCTISEMQKKNSVVFLRLNVICKNHDQGQNVPVFKKKDPWILVGVLRGHISNSSIPRVQNIFKKKGGGGKIGWPRGVFPKKGKTTLVFKCPPSFEPLVIIHAGLFSVKRVVEKNLKNVTVANASCFR